MYLYNLEEIRNNDVDNQHMFCQQHLANNRNLHYQCYKHHSCFLSCCNDKVYKLESHNDFLRIHHKGPLGHADYNHIPQFSCCKCYFYFLFYHIDKLCIKSIILILNKKIFCTNTLASGKTIKFVFTVIAGQSFDVVFAPALSVIAASSSIGSLGITTTC